MQQPFYLGADFTLCLCPSQCSFLKPSPALGHRPSGSYPAQPHWKVLERHVPAPTPSSSGIGKGTADLLLQFQRGSRRRKCQKKTRG